MFSSPRSPPATCVTLSSAELCISPPPFGTFSLDTPPSHCSLQAVGGNDITLSAIVSTLDTPLYMETANAATEPVAMGAVFLNTNGGTVWRNVPIFASRATATKAWLFNDRETIRTIYASYFPGILFAIHGTSNGKYLYAVGSPGSRYWADGFESDPITANDAPSGSLTVSLYPTILFSSNGGVSWVSQKGPNRKGRLTLFDVTVEKGSTAIACGGHPTINFGAGSNGAIILTTNGGFSWTQVYPLATDSTATPTLNCVSHQPAIAGVNRVWAGGYVTLTDQPRAVTAPTAVNVPRTGFCAHCPLSGPF